MGVDRHSRSAPGQARRVVIASPATKGDQVGTDRPITEVIRELQRRSAELDARQAELVEQLTGPPRSLVKTASAMLGGWKPDEDPGQGRLGPSGTSVGFDGTPAQRVGGGTVRSRKRRR